MRFIRRLAAPKHLAEHRRGLGMMFSSLLVLMEVGKNEGPTGSPQQAIAPALQMLELLWRRPLSLLIAAGMFLKQLLG